MSLAKRSTLFFKKVFKKTPLTATVIAFSLSSSCFSSKNETENITVPMRDAYQASAKLFTYVWSPSVFMKQESETEISALLLRLRDDFHKVDSVGKFKKDPGFEIALNAQRKLLGDAYERFNEGNKEYAWWKLKGVTHNCMACHSRFNSNTDFLGISPGSDDTTFESRLASAEFLIASRQFSKASHELVRLVDSVSKLDGGGSYAIQAIRLWLLVEVRVQESFHGAASELSRMKDSGNFTEEQKALISSWIVSLQNLQSLKASVPESSTISSESFDYARNLLDPLEDERTMFQDDMDFVKSARASSVLHSISVEGPTLKDTGHSGKSQLLLLLGVAYQRFTIPGFKDLSPMFFEQTIREFPYTKDAALAFKLYERDFHMQHTGSGGEYMSDEEEKSLEELRRLAVVK